MQRIALHDLEEHIIISEQPPAPAPSSPDWPFPLDARLAYRPIGCLASSQSTILLKLDLIRLQLQPRPVDNLVREHRTQKDFAKRDREGLVIVHLPDD